MDQYLIAEELKKTNAYLENIFENSPDAIGIVDSRGRFIKWNKMAAELYGYTFEQLLGKSTFDLYPDKKALDRMLTHLRREGSVKKWDIEMQRKDGTSVPFEISITLLRDDQNRTVGSVCVARDLSAITKVLAELRNSNEELSREIAERRKAEEEVRRLSRQNQLILDSVGEGIVGLDVFGRVTFINPAGAGTLGYDMGELLGKDLHELVHHSRTDGSRYPLHECPMFQSLSSGESLRERNEVFWRKDGSNYPVAYSSTPIREKDCVIGAVITFRDITRPTRKLEHLSRYRDHLQKLVEDRNAELEATNELLASTTKRLEQAGDKLQEASQTLKLFTYSIAHDLDRPTGRIELVVKRLHKHCGKVPDEKRKDGFLRVSENISALAAQMNTFVKAAKAPFSMETIDFQGLLRALENRFSSQLTAREIDWIEPDAYIDFRADRVFFPMALSSLVDNSLKYGGETLSQIRFGYEESNDCHIFSVGNDGAGLGETRFTSFFGFFPPNETSVQFDDTGLELAMAARIAKRHGGSLKIRPGDVAGATFYISISKNL
jgi:PAS domain S-box-containing protein